MVGDSLTEILIRKFKYPEDYPAARLLWENAGTGIHLRHSDDPVEIQKKLQRDPDLFLVVEIGGKMIYIAEHRQNQKRVKSKQ